MKILDCTLRDGGYYQKWDFTTDLVEDYLIAMKAASIDVVELGFRTTTNMGFHGPYAYTTEKFLESIVIPDSLILAVMVNVGELVKFSDNTEKVLNVMFPSTLQPKVTLVRLATHHDELDTALIAALWLKSSGYRVAINLMQITGYTNDELSKIAMHLEKHSIDILYFADTMGAMTQGNVEQVVLSLRKGWSGPIGIHAHDNMGRAMVNTLSALDYGATWVDCTVLGMGRGSGNVCTENLLAELMTRGKYDPDLIPLLSIIEDHFRPLKKEYNWGGNVYYYLAAKYNIHPSYIQEMLLDTQYETEGILTVIDHLKNNESKKNRYSGLVKIKNHTKKPYVNGKWSPSSVISGREVLIIASGPKVKDYICAIEQYIKIKKPFVISLNVNKYISEDLIDVYTCCHPIRIRADYDQYVKLNKPLVCPQDFISEEGIEFLVDLDVLDYSLLVTLDEYAFNFTGCLSPYPLVISYALCFATSGNASCIPLVGIDGYGANGFKDDEMRSLFRDYIASEGARDVCALTPTRYNIPGKSIFQLCDIPNEY